MANRRAGRASVLGWISVSCTKLGLPTERMRASTAVELFARRDGTCDLPAELFGARVADVVPRFGSGFNEPPGFEELHSLDHGRYAGPSASSQLTYAGELGPWGVGFHWLTVVRSSVRSTRTYASVDQFT